MLGSERHGGCRADDPVSLCRVSCSHDDCALGGGVGFQVLVFVGKRAVIELGELPEDTKTKAGEVRHHGEDGGRLNQAFDGKPSGLCGRQRGGGIGHADRFA